MKKKRQDCPHVNSITRDLVQGVTNLNTRRRSNSIVDNLPRVKLLSDLCPTAKTKRTVADRVTGMMHPGDPPRTPTGCTLKAACHGFRKAYAAAYLEVVETTNTESVGPLLPYNWICIYSIPSLGQLLDLT